MFVLISSNSGPLVCILTSTSLIESQAGGQSGLVIQFSYVEGLVNMGRVVTVAPW